MPSASANGTRAHSQNLARSKAKSRQKRLQCLELTGRPTIIDKAERRQFPSLAFLLPTSNADRHSYQRTVISGMCNGHNPNFARTFERNGVLRETACPASPATNHWLLLRQPPQRLKHHLSREATHHVSSRATTRKAIKPLHFPLLGSSEPPA